MQYFINISFILSAYYIILLQEDFFSSKKKREKKGKRKAVNEEIEEMMISTLDSIPKPRVLDLWPVTLTLWTVRSVLSIPAYVRRKKEEKRMMEEMMRLQREEEERIRRELQEYGKYSRTSMARTLMARLPRLFRTRSRVPLEKNPLAADLG